MSPTAQYTITISYAQKTKKACVKHKSHGSCYTACVDEVLKDLDTSNFTNMINISQKRIIESLTKVVFYHTPP